MNPKKISELNLLKTKFRNMPAAERESFGISLLKLNLDVANDTDRSLVRDFLGTIVLDLEPGKLDPLINFLHSESNLVPSDASAWFLMPPYREDEVDTLKDKIDPKQFQPKS